MVIRFFLSFVFILFLYKSSFTQDVTTRKEIQAYRMEENYTFVFDGRMDEPFWQKIDPATGFLMQEPREDANATEKTEVRIAYDDNYLYMGVMLYDSDPLGIKTFLKRRDVRLVSDDRFTWIFDTFNNQRSAYFMEINPNGLRTDGLLTVGQGSNINLNWDGIWDARTVIGDFGWSAEIRIPYKTLNFDPDSDTWGVNFMRVIRRKNETVLWTGHKRNQGISRPQNAGILTGLSDISQGLGLEVVPYGIITRSRDQTVTDPETSISPDGGFDINYSITPGLSASLTVNTDFAEAEVDQRQVNLTRFPLFFPEQRNFFLEGSNIFEFAPSSRVFPFFSRRIGLVEGQQVPITYGGRVLGNTGNYELALLHVRTGDSSLINPEHFTVGRIKRNFGSESTVGLIYTRRATVNRDEMIQTLRDRHTFGVDLELGTSSFLGRYNLQFQSFYVFHNSPIPDDNVTDIQDRSSYGFRLNFPNQPWSGHISYRELGEAFDPSVGFTPRNAFRRLNPRIGFSPQFENIDLIQDIEWSIWFEHLADLDFTLLTQDLRFTLFDINFTSGDEIEFDLTRNFERLITPFDIKRDGSIIVPVGTFTNWIASAGFETASQRRLSAALNFETGGFWTGSRTEYGIGITLRPFSGFDLTPEFIRTNVKLEEGDFSTDLLRFEGNFDFTTSHFLSTTLQFDSLSDVLGLNSRFRWIITPGSDLFLVYNHNWMQENSRFSTLQNTGTIKVNYTHRF